VDTSHLGFIQTAGMLISLITNSFIIGPCVEMIGGKCSDKFTVVAFLLAIAFFYLVEALSQKFFYFFVFSQIPGSVVGSILSNIIKGLFLSNVPKEHSGKSMGAYSIISSCIGIAAPIYGSHFLTVTNRGWVISGHYLGLCALLILCFPKHLVRKRKE